MSVFGEETLLREPEPFSGAGHEGDNREIEIGIFRPRASEPVKGAMPPEELGLGAPFWLGGLLREGLKKVGLDELELLRNFLIDIFKREVALLWNSHYFVEKRNWSPKIKTCHYLLDGLMLVVPYGSGEPPLTCFAEWQEASGFLDRKALGAEVEVAEFACPI